VVHLEGKSNGFVGNPGEVLLGAVNYQLIINRFGAGLFLEHKGVNGTNLSAGSIFD